MPSIIYLQYNIYILRRKSFKPPSNILALVHLHIPKSIMQSTPSPLPELYTLRHNPHPTPKRRQGNLLRIGKPRVHILNPLLEERPAIIHIHLINIRRNTPALSRLGSRPNLTLAPLLHKRLLLRRPKNPTLPASPRANLTLPLPRAPVHLALLPRERLDPALDTNLSLDHRPTERQRSPLIPPRLLRKLHILAPRTRHSAQPFIPVRTSPKHLPALPLPTPPVTIYHEPALVQFLKIHDPRANSARRQRRCG